ncbi:hypothetical protein [Bartonella birtlesii]|uniref:hypothetical protein n=1 Tax=Bartonella birtlesii TaxID=111504 RepID=UPI0002DFD8BF|nr:hypothetical protein [Bartonella birtlesii]
MNKKHSLKRAIEKRLKKYKPLILLNYTTKQPHHKTATPQNSHTTKQPHHKTATPQNSHTTKQPHHKTA